MKASLRFLFALLLIPMSAYCSDWVKVNIDTFASVEMPNYPKLLKNKVGDVYILKTDTIGYTVTEAFGYTTNPAKNAKELDEGYESFLKGMTNAAGKKNFKMNLISKKATEFKNLRCMDVQIQMEGNVNSTVFCRVIHVDYHDIAIMATYKSMDSSKCEVLKQRFFNSLNFSHNYISADQYKNTPTAATLAYKIGQILGALFFWGILIFLGIKLVQYYKWKY